MLWLLRPYRASSAVEKPAAYTVEKQGYKLEWAKSVSLVSK